MSTVGEYFAGVALRGLDEGVVGADGAAEDAVQSFQGTPADGAMTLPIGPSGPAGDVGPPAPAYRWEGDIADTEALAALTTRLAPRHAGRAWRVLSTDTVMVWNGSQFEAHADGLGGHGPDGPVNVITLGTVTTGAAGSDLVVALTGTSPTQSLALTVPRGVPGAEGPAGSPGPLRGAADYDNTITHDDGMVPLWDDIDGKWTPAHYPGLRGPWTAFEGARWDGGAGFIASVSGGSTTPLTICQIPVPAQDTAWRPLVLGAMLVRTGSSGTDVSTRVDCEARIGSNAGQLVALGPGLGYTLDWPLQLFPHWAVQGMTPASTEGVVAAGAAATIHLVLRRNLGSGTYTYTRGGAHAAVFALPVSGAPS